VAACASSDAVNVAARLESASEPKRTNVSAAVVAQTKAFFEFSPRGPIASKNKDPIEMYFLERLKQDYSADATGEVPNAAFARKRAELAEAGMSGLPNALG
jgi:hypothetical protein